MRTVTAARLAGALALGCQPTASIGVTAGEGGAATTTGSSTAIPTDTDATTNATTGPAETTSSAPDLGDGTDAGTTTDPTTGGLEPACMPAPFDVPCIECAKHECCEAFAACAADFNCSCTLGCIQYAGPFGCMCPPSALGGLLYECMTPTCNEACAPP